MSVVRRCDSPAGLQPGDHVCWTYADAEEFSSALLPFLDEGRRRGEQLVLTGESRARLATALSSLPECPALLDSGQLKIQLTDEVSGDGLDPHAQIAAYRREVDAALARGRTGLRLASDVTALAHAAPEDRRQVHVLERLGDVLTSSAPVTGLCLYDASLGDVALGPIALLHPMQHWGNREPVAHLSGRDSKLALHGEVDLTLADDVFRAVVDLAWGSPGEVVLDLSDLAFLDVAGARALTRAARLLADVGVDLRLGGSRGSVARCLELFPRPDGQVSRE